MKLDLAVKCDDSKAVLYWNDELVLYTSAPNNSIELNWVEGINTLIIESERLNPRSNSGSILLTQVAIDGTDTWPVDAGETVVNIPFSTLQGYTHTESGAGYVAYDNTLYVNSYIKIYFLIKQGRIIDHYYDRNDDNQDLYYDMILPKGYAFLWSDMYQAWIHKHLSSDYFNAFIDPNDTSTYGRRWKGVRVEYTETALLEDQARSNNLDLFPYGPNFFEDAEGLGFTLWLARHVFGSHVNKPLPSKLLAPILKRV